MDIQGPNCYCAIHPLNVGCMPKSFNMDQCGSVSVIMLNTNLLHQTIWILTLHKLKTVIAQYTPLRLAGCQTISGTSTLGQWLLMCKIPASYIKQGRFLCLYKVKIVIAQYTPSMLAGCQKVSIWTNMGQLLSTC